MKKPHTLTAERARELLSYDPQTGVLTWRVARGRVASGTRVTAVNCETGYVILKVDGRRVLAHRVIWLYVTGAWPNGEIDHLNGVRTDNRWGNMRDVNKRCNQENQRKAQITNITGMLGVSRADSKRGFRARISTAGAAVHLGTFKSPEEAHQAYLGAKRELHEGCTI